MVAPFEAPEALGSQINGSDHRKDSSGTLEEPAEVSEHHVSRSKKQSPRSNCADSGSDNFAGSEAINTRAGHEPKGSIAVVKEPGERRGAGSIQAESLP